MGAELRLHEDSTEKALDNQSSSQGVVQEGASEGPRMGPRCILESGRVQGPQGKDGMHSLPSPRTVLGPSWRVLSLLFHG